MFIMIIIITISILINDNSKYKMNIEKEYTTKMLSEGYVKLSKQVCVKYNTNVWVENKDD